MRAAIVLLTLTLIGAPILSVNGQSMPADVGPGRVAWFDLSTTNLPRSREFYGQLFGLFNGVVYVQVSDVQASCQKAKTLGGTVAPGFPFNLPGGVGAIALVVDPGGHPIGLYSRTRLPGGS